MRYDRSPTVDWADWARRWEAQQQTHNPRREERFRIMLELVAELVGPRPEAILDLVCGTGSLTARVLERFPTTRVAALDADPLLLAIGQETHGEAGGRLRWLRADPRSEDLAFTLIEVGPFDAVLTSGGLHSLFGGDLLRLYRGLHEASFRHGLFVHAGALMLGPPAGRLSKAARAVGGRIAQVDQALRTLDDPSETSERWWCAARAEPDFADLLAEREAVLGDDPPHAAYVPSTFHEEALKMAGFAETAVVWRYLDDTILAAIR